MTLTVVKLKKVKIKSYFISIEEFRKLSMIFLKIYDECVKFMMSNPYTKDRTRPPNYVWYQLAVLSGEKAKRYDPQTEISKVVKIYMKK